jgi:hypothetical protein
MAVLNINPATLGRAARRNHGGEIVKQVCATVGDMAQEQSMEAILRTIREIWSATKRQSSQAASL